MNSIRAVCLALLPTLWAGAASAQAIIVDHTSLPLFDQIPESYLTAAADLRMMFVDRSVGSNINDGLTCLTSDSDEDARTSCKRYEHIVPEFSSSPQDVSWNRPGGYDRANWVFFFWDDLACGLTAASWSQKLECFAAFVDANPNRFDVYSYQNTYLEVDESSDIASASAGYFVDHGGRYDIADFEALEARHPGRIFIHHTANLARGIGTQVSTDFNEQMRQYVRTNGKILLDVADIESHDPAGNPCYDNRDGVPYSAGNASENYPDDGRNLPAICQHYTRESDGGHLGNPDVGKIRLAKAFWILMAQVAGWSPPGGGAGDPPGGGDAPPPAPTNLRIIGP